MRAPETSVLLCRSGLIGVKYLGSPRDGPASELTRRARRREPSTDLRPALAHEQRGSTQFVPRLYLRNQSCKRDAGSVNVQCEQVR